MIEKPNLEELIVAHTEELKRKAKIEAELQFYKSLVTAVKEAGGCTDWITPETTLKELSDLLAVNNVRFYYVRQSNQRGV